MRVDKVAGQIEWIARMYAPPPRRISEKQSKNKWAETDQGWKERTTQMLCALTHPRPRQSRQC